MDKQKAFNLLVDVKEVLNDFGISFFVTDGTLLGAIRGGDFIDHDTDIDVGVFTVDFDDKKIHDLILELKTKQIKLVHGFGKFPKYFELAFSRDGIKVDFFFYKEEGDNYVFHAFRNGGKNLPADVIIYVYPKRLIRLSNGSLNEVTIQQTRFPAPACPHAFVQAKYGEGWHTPVKDWDWADDPLNKLAK